MTLFLLFLCKCSLFFCAKSYPVFNSRLICKLSSHETFQIFIFRTTVNCLIFVAYIVAVEHLWYALCKCVTANSQVSCLWCEVTT